MKRISLLIMVQLCCISAFCVTKTWVGASGDNWTNSASWSPASAPGTSDDVVFDGFNGNVVFTASVTGVGSISVKNNTFVTFQATGAYTMGNTVPSTLSVEAGSTLRCRDVSTTSSSPGINLSVTGPSTINGTVDLVSGSGSRLTFNSPGTLTINGLIRSGFETINGSAADAGFIVLSGGTLVFGPNAIAELARTNGVTVPFATWDASATLKITGAQTVNGYSLSWGGSSAHTLGGFLWDCPSQGSTAQLGFSSSSLTPVTTFKGDVVINNTNAKNIRFTSSNSLNETITFKGNLSVTNAATVFEPLYSSSAGTGILTWNLEKNLNIVPPILFTNNTSASTHLFRFQGSASGAGGTGSQNYNVSSLPTQGIISLTVNNGGNGVNLLSNTGNLKNITLSSGMLTLNNFNAVAGFNNGNINGSGVSGWVVTNGTGLLTQVQVPASGKNLPVGISATSYDPVAVTPASASDFSVRVRDASTGYTNAVNALAFTCKREWEIVSASTNAVVEFEPSASANCPASGTKVIGHYVGDIWTETSNAGAGPYNGYTYSANFTSFSPFGVGVETGFVNVSLPITLQSFRGIKSGTINQIDWKVNCTSARIGMEIERSIDARKFSSIHTITADQARCAQPFIFNDRQPLAAINYYRLKMIDMDGTVSYSAVIAIINNNKRMEFAGLYPTLVGSHAVLSVTAAKAGAIQIVINDISGRIIRTSTTQIPEGSSNTNIDCSSLAKGMYTITGYNTYGKTQTIRFVKN